jgi:hypothetical protein
MTLLEKEILMFKMIELDAEVTIGQYWKLIMGREWPKLIVLEVKVVVPKLSVVRDLPDPAPFKRPLAKYDNRSQEDIYNQYAPY